MVLSEFIKKLQELQKQYGDIPVAVANDYAELYIAKPEFVIKDKKFCCESLAEFAEGQKIKCIVV